MSRNLTLVLAHVRTGSSMAMQTLRSLGMPVTGSPERKGLTDEGSPRGSLTDLMLRRHPGLIERIGIDPTPEQRKRAEDNISPELYRYQQRELPEEYERSGVAIGTNVLHALLSTKSGYDLRHAIDALEVPFWPRANAK